MRLFFALDLDSDTRLAIDNWRQRQLHCDGRPVPAANFHVTLAFIGEVGNSALEALCQQVDEHLASTSAQNFTLALDQVGYWPRPGIFWLGSSAVPDAAKQLAKSLRGIASAAGGKRDKKPWQPHVTLYRRCNSAPPAPPSVPILAVPGKHVTLFESLNGRQGVSYHPVADWTLTGH